MYRPRMVVFSEHLWPWPRPWPMNEAEAQLQRLPAQALGSK